MSNPTTPFNWQMPTATDLVTDLPADFEVFGQAVATSMADLLGGTSGQILAKNSNTDMDFTWVAQDDSNAIQNAIVDAKGDLIGATAADTPARLAVGTNGQVLKANSAAATGLEWGNPTAIGCSLYRTADQSISNSTATMISWDVELYDTNSFHDNTTNPTRMTIPAGLGGKYLVSVLIPYTANAVGERVGYVHKNGTLFYLTSRGNLSATIGTFVNYSYIINLAATDYIEIQTFQSSGGALSVLGAVTYYANVQLAYLGA